MRKPSLKSLYQLIPGERILVERETGRRFQLTQGQTHICFLLDGTRDAGALRNEFLKRGVDAPAAEIERQIECLANLGVLEERAPAAQGVPPIAPVTASAAPMAAQRGPAQGPTHVMTKAQLVSELVMASPPTSADGLSEALGLEPTRASVTATALKAVIPLEPGDRAPLLRADLKMHRSPQGQPGVVEVEDPVANKRFKLYDFEVSVARMLNGQRTVAEVMQAAERLGLPINADSFRKFIRQLQIYGFLAIGPQPPAASTFPPRAQWDPGVRELFVSGVRMLRQGKLAEAQSYFNALLEIEPDNTEAREMLGLVESRQQSPGAAAVSVQAAPSSEETIDGAQITGEDEGVAPEALAPTTSDDELPAAPPSKLRARLRRWIPRFVIAAIGAGVLQIPLPLNVSAECQLVSLDRDVVRAAQGGFAREITVTQGQWVEKGEPVARLASGDLEKQLERREADVAQAQSELDLVVKGARKEEIARTQTVFAGRIESWRMSKKEFDRVKELFARQHVSADELSKAEERVSSQHSSMMEASAQLKLIEAAARPEEVAKREAQLRARLADRDMAKAELKGAVLVAPISGIVTTPNLKEKVGVRLEAGAVLLEIEDMRIMRVIAKVAESDLDLVEKGQKASIKVSNLPTRVFEGEVTFISPIIEEDVATATRFFRVESRIKNEEGALRPNLSGFAKLHAGERPLWSILSRGVVRWVRLRFLF